MHHGLRGCCILWERSRALFSGREDGVQLRRGHAQQRAYGGRRQVEPGGNGLSSWPSSCRRSAAACASGSRSMAVLRSMPGNYDGRSDLA